MKILVAEDDLSCQEITGFLLEQWGYEFDIAENGQMAVDLARRNEGEYDLCMMDINMPIIDGPEAAERIRRETSYFPILAMSMDPRNEKKCLESGMDAFLEKTYTFDELYYKIRELTVKSLVVKIKDNYSYISEEMPLDQEHAEEIRRLKGKGLAKVKFGINGEELILHKNATNKISHDFNVKENLISVFLNHNPEKPTRCELYKQHCHITQTYLDDGDYSIETDEEKKEMEAYPTRALKAEEG